MILLLAMISKSGSPIFWASRPQVAAGATCRGRLYIYCGDIRLRLHTVPPNPGLVSDSVERVRVRYNCLGSDVSQTYVACASGSIANRASRGVAQPGRALSSGGRGRRFKSSHPDQLDQRLGRFARTLETARNFATAKIRPANEANPCPSRLFVRLDFIAFFPSIRLVSGHV